MIRILYTELLKLKRYSVVTAGLAMTILSVLMTLFYATAQDGTVWTFAYYLHTIQSKNVQYFFPLILVLVGGFCITREEGDDTLKSLLTVPVSWRQLLAAKALALLLLNGLFSLFCALFAVAVNLRCRFPGMTPAAVVQATLSLLATNLLVYLAVSPLLFTLAARRSTFLFSLPLAFLYGYLATFEGNPLNFLPTKACLILTDPLCGDGFPYVYTPGRAALSLAVCGALGLAAVLLHGGGRFAEPARRAETVPRKKGW